MENVNKQVLDASVVREQALRGWSVLMWPYVSERQVPRNQWDLDTTIVVTIAFAVLGVLVWAAWVYLPFMWILVTPLLALFIVLLWYPIAEAHTFVGLLVLYTIVGGLASLKQWHIGFAVLGHDFDQYVYYAVLGAGLLGLLRWLHNAWLWAVHDRIVYRYYRDHRLPFQTVVTPIEDYQRAYHELATVCHSLLTQVTDDAHWADEMHGLLTNHTEEGRTEAMTHIKQRCNRE